MCCWYLILTTPTGPAMRPNDPNGPTNVDIAKPQILISWQGARLEVLWCLRNGWIWSRHSNWKQWQKANQQLHRSQTSPNFLLLSLSLSINYLHYLYLFNLFLSLCFNHFSVKSSFKSAPQAPGPPGPRRCFRSVSVHLQVLMNLVDIFVPALLRDDRRPGQSSCHVHGWRKSKFPVILVILELSMSNKEHQPSSTIINHP